VSKKITEGEFVRRQNRIHPEIVEMAKNNATLHRFVTDYFFNPDTEYEQMLENSLIATTKILESELQKCIEQAKNQAPYVNFTPIREDD
jgi:hypothetical protein